MTASEPVRGRRWPRQVYGVGIEPDPRFTFANERTFLAWIRTSVTLIAAGVSLDAFVASFPSAMRVAVSVALALSGTLCAAGACRRWMANERALRLGQPLRATLTVPVLAYGVTSIGLVVAVVILVR